MPYTKKRYGSKKKYHKYRRCIKEVSKGSKRYNPYAVCRASVYGKARKKIGVRF